MGGLIYLVLAVVVDQAADARLEDEAQILADRRQGVSTYYSKAACFEVSLQLDPIDASACHYLGIAGGGMVSSRTTAWPFASKSH